MTETLAKCVRTGNNVGMGDSNLRNIVRQPFRGLQHQPAKRTVRGLQLVQLLVLLQVLHLLSFRRWRQFLLAQW